MLAARLRRARLRAAQALAARAGLVTAPAGIYSPIPEQTPPEDDPSWTRPVPLHGIDLRLHEQLVWVRDELQGFIDEFDGAVRRSADVDFELWNSQYMAGDAELLYAIIRSQRPRRLLEIGSGNSTHVSAAACVRNAGEGHPVEFVAVDPTPRKRIAAGLPGLTRIERVDCRSLPAGRFDELEAGDVLFIDSSHIVKRGSEVNLLLLDVLPRLAPGVLVHVHDIYLPYEYHPHLSALGVHFNEQYLLQALLTENDRWEVVLAACALARTYPSELRALIPSIGEEIPGLPGFDYVPCSFWMRRAATGGSPGRDPDHAAPARS